MGIYIWFLIFCLGARSSPILLWVVFWKAFLLDWLFRVSSFWTVWVRVGPCIVWFILLLGLCFGLGLLQVWWSLKSTTSLNSALFFRCWPPHLTFSYQFSSFFSVLMIVHWFCFFFFSGRSQLSKRRPFFPQKRPFHGRHPVVFFGPRGLLSFFLCCYALVHAIALWQLLCLFVCSGVHQSNLCGLLIVFSLNDIESMFFHFTSLHVVINFLLFSVFRYHWSFIITNLIPQEFIIAIDVVALRHKFLRKFMM